MKDLFERYKVVQQNSENHSSDNGIMVRVEIKSPNFGSTTMNREEIEKIVRNAGGYQIDIDTDRAKYFVSIGWEDAVNGRLVRKMVKPYFVNATDGEISSEDGLVAYLIPYENSENVIRDIMSKKYCCSSFTNHLLLVRYNKNNEAIEKSYAGPQMSKQEFEIFAINVLEKFIGNKIKF